MNRHERDALERRRRAHAHLERVRAEQALPRRRLLPAFVLLASCAAGALWGESALQRLAGSEGETGLERIAVRGARTLDVEEILRASGVERGMPLDAVDAGDVAEQLEDHDWIAAAGAVALPSGTLLMRVEERVPLAVVEVGDPPTPFAVDDRGAPFGPLRSDASQDLPRLAPGASVTARQPNARLAEAVLLAHELPERGLALPEVIAIAPDDDPEGLALRLRGLPTRIVLGRSDLDARLDELATLLSSRADLVAGASRLDLRFAHQAVLRASPPPKGAAQAASARGSATASSTGPPG